MNPTLRTVIIVLAVVLVVVVVIALVMSHRRDMAALPAGVSDSTGSIATRGPAPTGLATSGTGADATAGAAPDGAPPTRGASPGTTTPGNAPEPGLSTIDVPPGSTASFYGDSYTLGTGASTPLNRWSSIISKERGWIEVNPSTNGLGFVNNRGTYADDDEPQEIIDSNPRVVFITMGLNDNFSFDRSARQIRKQITADFLRLSAALPGARFVVVEPFWYTDVRPASVDTIIGWVHESATAIGADYIPGASRWIEGHPEWMAPDGLHPNDDGYAEMARRMDASLEALGL
ncbi:SGNH/GDSL hydrolase family protein [Glaciihabitans sp. dw_435]|uniref:SGNH/GDSL hydrolase family protein n=1 Tax=Glaciihabitans sp. dw_435 TaxID=2720081 RepID=UPI0021065AF3|nr:SGNH/GDSL hydrolase family protein [Glaciihabitans sp. dw_435]